MAGLPLLTARSSDSPAVIATALETALHDKAVCCGKDSALEDAVGAEPRTLKELGARLQGKHSLPDGQSIVVNAEYVPQASVTSGLLIPALLEQHPALIEWKSHVYVLYGAIFNDTLYTSGARAYAIVKLFLLDPRFSGQRREAVFNRDGDDWGKVQGLLTLAVVRP